VSDVRARPDGDRGLRVVIATRNAGKLRELRAMFAEADIGLDDLTDVGLGAEVAAEDALETHATFEENARAKARWFAARLPGRLVVADDSGLEVDALGGAPGVRSKRWAGSSASGAALEAENNAALQAALRRAHDHAQHDASPGAREAERGSSRVARYVCVVVAVQGEREVVARGECTGRIQETPEGSNGFGYDPYFRSDELGVTFGVATRDAKARVSHRGRAFRALLAQLRSAAHER
jgi:XTP/dITP diphosphohydrolase